MAKGDEGMRKAKGKGMEGGLGSMGMGKFANMPDGVIMKAYPKKGYGMGGELDDTISGIDEVSKVAEGKAKSYLSYQK